MIRWLKRAWLKHVLFRTKVPYSLWHKVIHSTDVLKQLSSKEKHKLRKLTGLFLHDKTITAAGGINITECMSVYIAVHA